MSLGEAAQHAASSISDFNVGDFVFFTLCACLALFSLEISYKTLRHVIGMAEGLFIFGLKVAFVSTFLMMVFPLTKYAKSSVLAQYVDNSNMWHFYEIGRSYVKGWLFGL